MKVAECSPNQCLFGKELIRELKPSLTSQTFRCRKLHQTPSFFSIEMSLVYLGLKIEVFGVHWIVEVSVDVLSSCRLG